MSVPFILVSACLLGNPVRYDGRTAGPVDPRLEEWSRRGWVLPVCPEIEGGLPTPRPPAEIAGGASGDQVLAGRARVLSPVGDDVTGAYVAGAETVLQLARSQGVRAAILKEGSPSCGTLQIHDGAFSGRRIPGRGVLGAALAAVGIPVFNEHQIAAAAKFLPPL
jgi:uncharacterized protein YbbK (DUF523 family)